MTDTSGNWYVTDDNASGYNYNRGYVWIDGGNWNSSTAYETFRTYEYDWTSTTHDIHDTRKLLSYEWVSQEHDIWGLRPKYETYEQETKVVEEKNITIWKTVPVVEEQTVLRTSAVTDARELPYGDFSAISIQAGDALDLDAAGDLLVKGVVQTESGALSLDADGNVTVQGQVPTGAPDPDTLAAQARVAAPDTLEVLSGKTLQVGDSGLIQVTDQDGSDGTLHLHAGRYVNFGGEAESVKTLRITSDQDIQVSGVLTAVERVDILAGQGLSGAGDITTVGADIETTADSSDISGSGVNLEAGANSGDILLTALEGGAQPYLTGLSAQNEVRLTAESGRVEAELYESGGADTEEALIQADTVTVRAAEGATLRTDVRSVDVEVSGTGNVRLTTEGEADLSRVRTADGSISVTAYGDLTATDVVTLGGSDQDDITLTTRDEDGDGPETADLTLHTVTAAGLGDVILDVMGSIGQAGGAVTADTLDVTVQAALTMTTEVSSLAVETQVAGDVSITQLGTDTLTVSGVQVMDGSFTLNHAGGSVILGSVELLTDRQGNTVTVTAGGDIQVGWLSAGTFYASADDVPLPAPGDDPGQSSKADVVLTAAGRIREQGSDEAVDLVADQVTLHAGTGIEGIDLAANELLDVTSTTGDITLTERDGAGENRQGVVITLAEAQAGSVDVTALDYLEAHHVRAMGADGLVRLTSTNGNLVIGEIDPDTGEPVKPEGLDADEEALEFTRGIALTAGSVLMSYRFFDPDRHLEYRAGQAFRFDLPDDLNADTIILDLGPGLQITENMSLTASDRVELASDTNVYVSGTLQGEGGGQVAEVAITGRGTGSIGSSVWDEGTGFRVYARTADPGDRVVYDSASGRIYTHEINGKHVFRGTYMPEGGGSTVVTYFADNAEGTGTLYTSADGASFTPVADRSDVYDLTASVWEVTGSVDIADYEPFFETTSGGHVEIQDGASVAADRFEIRAARTIDVTQAGSFAVSGFLGGIEGYDGAESVTLDVGGDLTFAGGIVSSEGDLVIEARSIAMDAASVLMAPDLDVTTAQGMALSTMADTITADVTAAGGITVKEADGVTLSSVTTESGSVEITAGGTLTAVRVETDQAGDITLKSGANLLVGKVETTTTQGMEKTSGAVLLDAYGQILESPTDDEMDVLAHTITLRDSDGSVSGLDTMASSDLNLGGTQMTAGGIPAYVEGDYVLMAPTPVPGDVDLHVTGDLSVVSLGTHDGQSVAFQSDGDMVIAADIDVGATGTVILESTGDLSVGGTITAGTLRVKAPGDLILENLNVQTILFEVTGGGLTLENTGDLAVASAVDFGTFAEGALRIDTSGNLQVTSDVDAQGDVALEAGGALSMQAGKVVDAGGGNVTLTAGGGASGLVDAANLSVEAGGSVSVRDVNDVRVTGLVQNAAGQDVTVTAGGALVLAEDVTLASGTLTLDADGGTLSMEEGTVVNAGAGSVDLEASSHVSLGRIETSGAGTVRLASETGTVTGPLAGLAVDAAGSTLHLEAAAGIGQGTGLQTRVAALTAVNGPAGAVLVDEADALAIQGVTQTGTGAVTVFAGGPVTVEGAGITAASGPVTLHADGSTGGIALDAGITTTGGDVFLTTDRNDILFGAETATGTGDITIQAANGSVKTARTGWTVGDPVVPDLSTSGTLRITAMGGIGEAVEGERVSSRSLVVDAAEIFVKSLGAQPVHVIATGAAQLGETGVSNPLITGGGGFTSLGQTLDVSELVVGSGADLSVIAGDVSVSHALQSRGGVLTIASFSESETIVIGDLLNGTVHLHVDQAELDHLAEGFDAIRFGGAGGSYTIQVGDPDNPSGTVTVSDPLILTNPGDGGHTHLYGTLMGTDDASLTVQGSGSTATAHGTVIDEPGAIIWADAVDVDGTVSMTSRNDEIHFQQTLDGDGLAGDDTLLLSAGTTITFDGVVGGDDPLEGLIVTDASGVTFNSDLFVSGDVTLSASGTVTFGAGVTLTGGGTLTVTADRVRFLGTATVAGDMVLTADEVDFEGGADSVASSGGGSLSIQTRTQGLNLTAALENADARLDLTDTDLAALTDGGFGRIEIGAEDAETGHADSSAGSVRIGGTAGTHTFRDPTWIFGRTLTVADEAEAEAVLGATEDLHLDALGALTIENGVQADAGLYLTSVQGRVEQKADAGDGLESEAVAADHLFVRSVTGTTLPWTAVGTLDAANTGDGDILLCETAAGGSVTVQNITQAGADRSVSLTTRGGSITVTGSGIEAEGGGLVSLTAQGASSDILVESRMKTTGAGKVSLSAGRDTALAAEVTSAGGLVELTADGEVRMDEGGAARSMGGGTGRVEIEAGTHVLLEQAEADDRVEITAQTGRIGDSSNAETANICGDGVSVRLSAAAGIGAAGVADLDTAASDLIAVNTGSNGIFIEEADSLRIAEEGLHNEASGAPLVLLTTAGTLTVEGTVEAAGAGAIRLEAGGEGSNLVLKADVESESGPVTLLAADGIDQQAHIRTGGGSVDVEAFSGFVTMTDGTSAASSGGDVRYAAGTDVTLAALNAGAGNVSVAAGSGSIRDGGDAARDVTAAGLRLVAGTGVGTLGEGVNALDTEVATVAAEAGAGGISLSELDGLAVDAVQVSVNRVQTDGGTAAVDASLSDLATDLNGSIVVRTEGGTLTVNEGDADDTGVLAGGSGNVLLEAQGEGFDVILNADVESGSGHVTILAADDVEQRADIATGGGSVDVEAGAGRVFMEDGRSTNSAGGPISYEADLNLTLAALNAGDGDVSLTSRAGSILDGGDAGPEITASGLRLSAAGSVGLLGAGVNPLDTVVETVAAEAGAGGISLSDADDVTVGAVNVTVDRVGTDGSSSSRVLDLAGLTTSSGGSIVLRTVDGDLASNRTVSASGSGRVLLEARGAGSDVTLTGPVSSGHGAVTVLAPDRIVQSGRISTGGGSVDVEAAEGSLTVTGGAESHGGSIRYAARGNVALTGLNAGNGNVSVTSAAGSILDAGGSVDVTASGLLFRAAGDVGRAGDPLETDVAVSAVQAGGGIYLSESNSVTAGGAVSAVTVDRVAEDGETRSVTDAGLTGLTAGGPISVDAGGTLTLGTLTAGGTAMISAGGSILGSGGTDVTAPSAGFRAGGSVGVRESAPLHLSVGSVAAFADHGDIHLVNAGTVTVADVGGVRGLSAAGSITLESRSGDIVVSAPVNTHGDGETVLRFPNGSLIENGDFLAGAGTFRWTMPGEVRFLWIADPASFFTYPDIVFGLDDGDGGSEDGREHVSTILTEIFETPESGLSAFGAEEGRDGWVRLGEDHASFFWSSFAGAESYLLVIERNHEVYFTLWLEDTSWQTLEGLSSGYYEWTVYAWTPMGMQVACGPLSFQA